jgi:biopolymer transport protein ExbD
VNAVLDQRARLTRKGTESPSLLLTPFIDVLLVLLCFVLAVSFQIRAAVDVKLPEASTGQLMTDDHLTVSISRDSSLIIQGRPVTVEGLPAVLRQVLAKLPAGTTPSAVIQGDEQIPYALLVQVMDALRAQGITDLSLLTESRGGR